MRRVLISRARLGTEPLDLPDGAAVSGRDVDRRLDAHGVPDGLPFLVDDNGAFAGVWSINAYLLDAYGQNGLDLGSMGRSHVYNLARPLRFLRLLRAQDAASRDGTEVDEWLADNGEPVVDLTAMTRAELTSYADSRGLEVSSTSWNTELGTLSAFFDYAVLRGWMAQTPIPRWGQRNRNTLAKRVKYTRDPKFLTEAQLRHFLVVGLRGDDADDPPAFPERDHAFGLVLASMGLRREEGALLLDCELPALEQMPSNGVWPFTRVGKGLQPRTVYATTEMVRGIDLYRTIERSKMITAAQPGLRALHRGGGLLMVDHTEVACDGRPVVVISGRRIPTHRLSDEDRSRLALRTVRGEVEPLALFVGRRGTAPDLKRWNDVFAQARQRVHDRGSPDRPPAHLVVTPHVMRHTYAVRMLSALMHEGRRTAQDPYALLANPVLTVMQLLGHASMETTQRYLYAAERYDQSLPDALRRVASGTIGARDVATQS